jgi:phage terminase small subunit
MSEEKKTPVHHLTGLAMDERSAKERLLAFKQAYVENGGKIIDAYIKAGFSKNSAQVNASQYFAKHREEIESYFRTHMAQYAPQALTTILTIMNDSGEKGGIRLKAAQDILDRCGYKPKEHIEITTEEVENMSTAQIKDRIKELLSEVDPEIGNIVEFKARK